MAARWKCELNNEYQSTANKRDHRAQTKLSVWRYASACACDRACARVPAARVHACRCCVRLRGCMRMRVQTFSGQVFQRGQSCSYAWLPFIFFAHQLCEPLIFHTRNSHKTFRKEKKSNGRRNEKQAFFHVLKFQGSSRLLQTTSRWESKAKAERLLQQLLNSPPLQVHSTTNKWITKVLHPFSLTEPFIHTCRQTHVKNIEVLILFHSCSCQTHDPRKSASLSCVWPRNSCCNSRRGTRLGHQKAKWLHAPFSKSFFMLQKEERFWHD